LEERKGNHILLEASRTSRGRKTSTPRKGGGLEDNPEVREIHLFPNQGSTTGGERLLLSQKGPRKGRGVLVEGKITARSLKELQRYAATAWKNIWRAQQKKGEKISHIRTLKGPHTSLIGRKGGEEGVVRKGDLSRYILTH